MIRMDDFNKNVVFCFSWKERIFFIKKTVIAKNKAIGFEGSKAFNVKNFEIHGL
jgi:hypothetical protein